MLAGYLVGKSLINFVVTKPTSTSSEVVKLDSETFPNVVICGEPAIDSQLSRRYGYNEPAAYWLGQNGSYGGNFIGWNGVEGKKTSVEVREELLNMKMGNGLVNTNWYVLQNGSYESDYPSAELIMVSFPYGRCQLLKPQQNPEISGYWLEFHETALKPFTHLNILLIDPVNSPLVYPTNFEMKGSQIKVKIDASKKSWHPYQIKISQSRHVKDDPQYECKEYSLNDTYGECITKEWKEKFLEMLNCTPPMLDMGQMCNKRFDVRGERVWEIQELFFYWSLGAECNDSRRFLKLSGFAKFDIFRPSGTIAHHFICSLANKYYSKSLYRQINFHILF